MCARRPQAKRWGIEVAASKSDLYQSVGQLKCSRKPKKYIAVPSALVPEAKKSLEGSGIGIMDDKRRIRKKARRK